MRLPVRKAMEVCPIEVAVSVLGGTWKLTLVKHMAEGPRRFGELRRLLPLANRKTLTRQLRELEQDGIVHRRVLAKAPPAVDYSLTDLGSTLAPLVDAMNAWGKTYALHAAQPSSQEPSNTTAGGLSWRSGRSDTPRT